MAATLPIKKCSFFPRNVTSGRTKTGRFRSKFGHLRADADADADADGARLNFRRGRSFQPGQNRFRRRILREEFEIHDGRNERESGDEDEHSEPTEHRIQELGDQSQDWSRGGLTRHHQAVVLASVSAKETHVCF